MLVSPARQVLLLAAMAAVLFFVGLGSLPLLEPDEGRNAEVGREMLAAGDWITPHYDTLPYLDKPAVFFWLEAASFRLAGATEWAARLPSALAALGTLLLAWFLARRMFARSAPLVAGIVFATCPLAFMLARLAIFDMTLVFFMTAAMVGYWMAREGGARRARWQTASFAAMGVASITKGPVGFILPLISIVVFEALSARSGELKKVRWLGGIAVLLAVALPWFILVSVRNPGFPRYAFWEESLVRFTKGGVRRGGSLFYYVPVFLAGLFPWSLFLIIAALNCLSRWKELRDEKRAPELFLLTWAAVVFVFFSVSHSKLPGYFLPAAIPLSILTARVWSEVEAAASPPDWLTAGFSALVAAGLLTAFIFWLPVRFSWLEGHRSARIPPAALSLIRPTLIYTGVIVAAWGVLGRKLAARRSGRTVWLTLAAAALVMPSVFLRWLGPIREYAEFTSARTLARTIQSSPVKDLPVYGYYYFRTSLPFYLSRPVGLVTDGGGELTSNYVVQHLDAVRSNPGASELLLDYRGFYAKAQTSPEAFLVVARNSHVGLLARATGRGDALSPLWTEWQDSVWEVAAARPGPNR